MTTPSEILQQIQDGLVSSTPAQLIEKLLPFTDAEAVTWVRRLPFWEEFRGEFSGQAIAVARLVSLRSMREFGLAFDRQGKVVPEDQPFGYVEKPTSIFPLKIGEDTVNVRYTRYSFPYYGKDSFSFVGERLPDHPKQNYSGCKPHSLSSTGWWSITVPHDAVEAYGGPEAFAALYAQAKLRGEDKEFEAVFEGNRQQSKPKYKRKAAKPIETEKPVIGEHTAHVVQEQTSQAGPGMQKSLFDELS